MPYADPEAQRKAKRESAARQRARDRSVEPAVEPDSELTWDELAIAARILLAGPRGWGETLPEYRERIREQWRLLKRVIGEP
jgi:hypothetical protein